jgi:hypothetical protein
MGGSLPDLNHPGSAYRKARISTRFTRSVWAEKLGRCDIIAETTIDPNAVMLTIKQRLLEAIDRAPIEELEARNSFGAI